MEKTLTVPLGYVRYLLDRAERQGYDIEPLLASVDISVQELSDAESFPAEKFGLLYQRIMWLAQDETFGIFSGGRMPNGTFRMACLCMIHCRNLEKVIRRCGEFLEVCRGASIKPVVTRRGRYAKLHFMPLDSVQPESVQALLEEADTTSIRTSYSIWHHFLSWLIGRRIELKAAYFKFSAPEDSAHYPVLFHSDVKFDQHENALIFPAEYLDLPLVQTEETLRGFLKTAPYQLLVMVDDEVSLKAQIRAILGKDFSRELPSAESMATQLNMSVSTLRRRLTEEGTSYQKIKDECRREAALNYLSSPNLSISDVASLMGYDEPSAFFRAFKKWTGKTPGEYRNQVRWRGLDTGS